ncbi:MAG: hypothetical protein ABIB47_04420 [Candidatus Woesearchaeota archaeon]
MDKLPYRSITLIPNHFSGPNQPGSGSRYERFVAHEVEIVLSERDQELAERAKIDKEQSRLEQLGQTSSDS